MPQRLCGMRVHGKTACRQKCEKANGRPVASRLLPFAAVGASDLEDVLADLKRQRSDIDARIHALEAQRNDTSDVLERLAKWREQAEKRTAADETLRTRR